MSESITTQRFYTPIAKLSWPELDSPTTVKGDTTRDPEYRATLLFSPEAQQTPEYKALVKAAITCAEEKWGSKAKQMIRDEKINNPFLSATEKGYDPDRFEGWKMLRTHSKFRPSIVDRYLDPATGKPREIPNDSEEIYAGCLVRCSVTVKDYDVTGNKGITFYLGNIQKMGDDERLGGGVAAVDEFDAEPLPESALEEIEAAQDAVEAEAKKGEPAGADDADEDLFG